MRKRELINRLKADRDELSKASARRFGSGVEQAQDQSARRLMILHSLERLLPEIIAKLDADR